MANPFLIRGAGPAQRIVAETNGYFLIPGNVSEGRVGAWSCHFVPDEDFAGELVVMHRSMVTHASADDVAFVPCDYRIGTLNNVPQGGWPWTDATITQNAVFQVPANGLSVAVFVSCTAGSGVLYNVPLIGSGAL